MDRSIVNNTLNDIYDDAMKMHYRYEETLRKTRHNIEKIEKNISKINKFSSEYSKAVSLYRELLSHFHKVGGYVQYMHNKNSEYTSHYNGMNANISHDDYILSTNKKTMELFKFFTELEGRVKYLESLTNTYFENTYDDKKRSINDITQNLYKTPHTDVKKMRTT